MDFIKNIWKNEPAGVVTVITALLALVTAFGLSLTSEQVGAIVTFFTLLGGLITRSQVSSTAALKEYAALEGAAEIHDPTGADLITRKPPDVGYATRSLLIAVALVIAILVGVVWLIQNINVN